MLKHSHLATVSTVLLGLTIGSSACSTGTAGNDHEHVKGSSESEEDDDDQEEEVPITGEALAKASAAALAFTGGGKVTGTEVGDEESYYEVEVTMPDGRQTDVQLDEDFKVVSSAADGPEDDDGEE